jgi:hypothetical protein
MDKTTFRYGRTGIRSWKPKAKKYPFGSSFVSNEASSITFYLIASCSI